MGKKLKLIGKLMTYVVSILICMIIGSQFERIYQQKLLDKLEKTEKIAIVNMDEGVWIRGEYINYANQLMYLPNDKFIITGLTDAKSGIENGTYAAYIVLPEDFSISINSIADNPNKISIEYQFNTKLTEQAEMQAVNYVYNFIYTLNSNISFVYLDAILAEFHQVQDKSVTILNNDMNELQLLTNVDADDLIATVSPVEEVSVAKDLTIIDLQPYYSNNNAYLQKMKETLTEAMVASKEEFSTIQESSAEISTAFNDFFTLYDDYMVNMEQEHSEKIKEGEEALYEAIGIYNANINYEDMAIAITELIEYQRKADEQEAERQMREILNDLGINEAQYEIHLGICEEASREQIDGLVMTFYDKTLLESEKQKIVDIVEEKLVTVLLDYNMSQKEIFENSRTELFDKMSTYESKVLAFNPMNYVENANLNQYLSDIEANSNEMYRLVQTNNQEYITYANEVYATTNENCQKLVMALNEANQQTILNVETCIGQLADSRVDVNEQNVDILENFTQLLPYTRVSTQENTEIYDYIISPVKTQGIGINVSEKYLEEEIYLKELLYVILLLGILAGSTNIVIKLWVNRRRSRQMESK